MAVMTLGGSQVFVPTIGPVLECRDSRESEGGRERVRNAGRGKEERRHGGQSQGLKWHTYPLDPNNNDR